MENENTNAPIQGSSAPVESVQKTPVISINDWLVTILITIIPIVNIIMLFVWAFSKNENPSKANWAKANLIWAAISVVLMILFASLILSSIASMFRG